MKADYLLDETSVLGERILVFFDLACAAEKCARENKLPAVENKLPGALRLPYVRDPPLSPSHQ